MGSGVSRKRPAPAEENFARHSSRVLKALKTGEIDAADYLILKVLTDEIEPPGSGGEVLHTLANLAELLEWSLSRDWLRKKLHALRDTHWIDFDEPRRGRDAAWIFRLGRAAIDGEETEFQTPSRPLTDSEGGPSLN